MVPPDELIPYLLVNELIHIDHEAIEEYWKFLASKGMPWTADEPGTGCIPLWLWGDDSVFNERGSKIVIVSLGCVLDKRSSSKETVFPLFVYQVDSRRSGAAATFPYCLVICFHNAICAHNILGKTIW